MNDRSRESVGLGKDGYMQEIELLEKSKYFTVIFIFSILSFSLQFPIANACVSIKLLQTCAWVLLFFSGYFAIKKMNGFAFPYIEKLSPYLSNLFGDQDEKKLWGLFYIAILILMFARCLAVFL